MSKYRYLPLSKSPNTIRLLRLFPSADETAEIRVELFEYHLDSTSKKSHPYEALSYSWHGVNNGQSILVDNDRFDTTPNLHAALSQLRDCGLPRILWIDAICINQADNDEKARQIQYMATIYGKASQVLVWLGPTANNSNEALQAVRAAGRESAIVPKDLSIEEAVTSLLQREWFRRVWVLQEVAAARRVLIMCGDIEIDGHAFCTGLERFEGKMEADFGLRRQVHSLIYLIRQAAYRSQLVLNSSGRASLDICTLGELIDMYHDRGATMRHDKIYALLGMSTDDLDESGLLPDYRTPWHELMQRLVKYLLGRKASIKPWSEGEGADISGKGCVIGMIDRIENDNGRQKVSIRFNHTYGQVAEGYHYWHMTLRGTANHVQLGDVVCQLQGAPKPMIVRPSDEHWTVVTMVFIPKTRVRIKSFPRNFRVSWDWKTLPDKATLRRERFSGKFDQTARLWDMGMILKDAQDDVKAEEKVLEAIQALKTLPTEVDGRYVADEMLTETMETFGKEVVFLLLKKMWDQLDLPNLWTNIVQRQDEEVVALLLNGHPDGCKILTQERGLCFAANNSNPKVLSLLLNQSNKAEVHVTEAVVATAVANWDSGLEMLSILLQEKKDDVKITEAVIQAIAYSTDDPDRGPGKEIMKLLLTSKGLETCFTEAMVAQVVETFDMEVVSLLFHQHGDKIKITEALIVVATKNNRHEIEVLTFLLDRDEHKLEITDALLEAVYRSYGMNRNQTMMFLLNRLGKNTVMTEPIVAAIINYFGPEVFELLFNMKGDEIQITETIIIAAASSWDGTGVFEFLLDRAGDDLHITEAIVKAAVSCICQDQLTFLLKQWKDEIKITETVIQAAANRTTPLLELLLDFDNTIQISEAVAEAAADRWDPNIGFLLERKRDTIQITECVLEAAVKNKKVKNEVIQQLLHYDVRVTEKILAAAAADEKDASRLTLLLDQRGGEIVITEAVVRAALSNWEAGEEVMAILLDRKRDDLLLLAQTTADDGLREKLGYWVPKKSHYSFECFTWIPSTTELHYMKMYESSGVSRPAKPYNRLIVL